LLSATTTALWLDSPSLPLSTRTSTGCLLGIACLLVVHAYITICRTMTAWGKDHEVDAMRNMLEQFPNGLVACVSDSYNIW